jgi:hypothetical protein
MWGIEESRHGDLVCISSWIPEQEAQIALRLLRCDRPWRRYRLVPADPVAKTVCVAALSLAQTSEN